MGSKPIEGKFFAEHGFTMLILCAAEHQPKASAFPGIENVLRVGFDDSYRVDLSDAEWQRIQQTAWGIAGHIMHGGRALVTCQMGRRVRGKHVANVLSNPKFIQLLTSIPPYRSVG